MAVRVYVTVFIAHCRERSERAGDDREPRVGGSKNDLNPDVICSEALRGHMYPTVGRQCRLQERCCHEATRSASEYNPWPMSRFRRVSEARETLRVIHNLLQLASAFQTRPHSVCRASVSGQRTLCFSGRPAARIQVFANDDSSQHTLLYEAERVPKRSDELFQTIVGRRRMSRRDTCP